MKRRKNTRSWRLIAPKEPLRERPHIHPLNTFQGVVLYGYTTKQADLTHAFMSLLGIHTGAQGIHLVIIAVSIECKYHVSVIGLHTSCCMIRSS
jgi:hypothetical protein